MHPIDVGSAGRDTGRVRHLAREGRVPALSVRVARPPAFDRAPTSTARPALTPRETEVLAEMATGKTNAAIARVLFISRKAVEKHVNSIFSKLLLAGLDDGHPRVQAVLIYLAHLQPGIDAPPAAPGFAAVRGVDRHTPSLQPSLPRHRGTAPGCRRPTVVRDAPDRSRRHRSARAV
jgi:DNA-binding CsgD family transcriptional regulator